LSGLGSTLESVNNVSVAQTVAAASHSNIPGAKEAIPKEGEAINTGANVILAAGGGVGIARAAPGLWAKFMALIGKEAAPESGRVLYHYTTEAGAKGILESEKLFPSLKQLNPKDARYGNGQYLSDIAPGTKSAAQLSREFLGMPFQGARFTHYVEIDVRGLNVVQGRPGVYVVPNEGELQLINRIMSSGKNTL
jgi:hypothetical protein